MSFAATLSKLYQLNLMQGSSRILFTVKFVIISNGFTRTEASCVLGCICACLDRRGRRDNAD